MKQKPWLVALAFAVAISIPVLGGRFHVPVFREIYNFQEFMTKYVIHPGF